MSDSNDAATHIIMQLNACSFASQGLVYLPAASIGEIVADALYLRDEINRLQAQKKALEDKLNRCLL